MNWHVGRCGHHVELCECEDTTEAADASAQTRHAVTDLDVPGPQHPATTTTPGGVSDSQLAVLLRTTQWACDDAAYHCAGGMLTPQRRDELAGTLEALAAIVRASTPEHTTQSQAGRRLSAPVPLPAPGDRPGPLP